MTKRTTITLLIALLLSLGGMPMNQCFAEETLANHKFVEKTGNSEEVEFTVKKKTTIQMELNVLTYSYVSATLKSPSGQQIACVDGYDPIIERTKEITLQPGTYRIHLHCKEAATNWSRPRDLSCCARAKVLEVDPT